MKKIIKIFLIIYLFFGFVNFVHAETYALNKDEAKNGEQVVPEDALIIGTHLITDSTKASTQLIMEATQTIVGDDAVIFQKLLDKEDAADMGDYPEGWWIDAINGDEMVPANVNGLICITHLNGNQVSDPNCNATRFSVKFESTTAEGGEKTVSIVNGEKIASADVPTPETKRGKKFVCWIEQENEQSYNGQDSCFKFGETIKKSVTLVPYYEDITYTIKFDINGGSTSNPSNVTCTLEQITSNDEDCKLPTVEANRKGYKFDGWSSVKDASGEEGTHYEAGKQMTDKLGEGEENEITLYAVWTPILYTITYQLDGGTYKDQTIVKSSYNILVKEAIDLFVPTKVGYTFNGWDIVDPSDGDKPTVSGTGDPANKYTLDVAGKTGDVTLKAKWKEKEYTITYDLNLEKYPELANVSANNKVYATMLAENLVKPNDTTCKFQSGCDLAQAPERDDYIFAGWADDDGYLYTGGNSYIGVDFGEDKSQVKLTAQWNAKNEPLYSITYDLDGGKFPNGSFDKYGSKMLETSLPQPEKIGYTFAGWCTDEAKSTDCKSTGATIKDALGNNGETLKELKLYAKWTPITYKVKFFEKSSALGISLQGVPGAGFDEMEDQEKECTYDQECKLSNHSQYFENKKEKLYGWSLNYGEKSNNNDIYLSDNITVKNLSSTQGAEVDLYAVTEDLVYSITYYLDGGEFGDENHPESATKDDKITIKNPTRDGYTFDKWVDEKGNAITNEEVDGESDSIKVTVTKNMILVATWKKDHQIEVYLDGGKLDSSNDNLTTTKYKDGQVVTIKNPTKDGYAFDKWVDKDGKDIETEDDAEEGSVKIKVNKDLFLVAIWTQKNPEMKATNDNISGAKVNEPTTVELKISPNNHNGTKVKIVATITKDGQPLTTANKVEARLNEVDPMLPFLSTETSQNDTSGKLTLPTSSGFRLKPGSACELATIDGACAEKGKDGFVTKKYDFKFTESGTYKVKLEVFDFNYPEDGPLSTTEITVTVSN